MRHYYVALLCAVLIICGCKNTLEEKIESDPDSISIETTDGETSLENNESNKALNEMYENLLKTGAINEEQFKEAMKQIEAMKNSGGGDAAVSEDSEDNSNLSDAAFRKKQLEKYNKKIQEKNKVKSQSQIEAEEKTQKLRKVLGTKENSFIEENITRYSLWGNRDLKESLTGLEDASKEEAQKILTDYFGISKKELELLKMLPSKQKIRTETEARKIAAQPLPPAIASHINSKDATAKFKTMMTSRKNDMIVFSGDVLKASAAARKEFYKKNPGWFGEGETSGDTYRDSRDKFIYLPLGDLSFSDKLISHDVGNPKGSNAPGALGVPDMDESDFPNGDPRICNIGIEGQLVLEFTNNAISDVNGPDLYVFEMGALEPTNLEISKDGNTWILVGKIEGGTAMVDIGPFAKKGETYTYVRLTDLDTPSQLPGADVDAVAAIGGAIRLNLDSAVLFDTGKYNLKESASKELKNLVAAIKEMPKGTIIIEGHTDNVGDPGSNETLSENRASAVRDYLKKNLSAQYSFQVKGFGENQPVAPNDNDENRQKNRRVEILVIPTN